MTTPLKPSQAFLMNTACIRSHHDVDGVCGRRASHWVGLCHFVASQGSYHYFNLFSHIPRPSTYTLWLCSTTQQCSKKQEFSAKAVLKLNCELCTVYQRKLWTAKAKRIMVSIGNRKTLVPVGVSNVYASIHQRLISLFLLHCTLDGKGFFL